MITEGTEREPTVEEVCHDVRTALKNFESRLRHEKEKLLIRPDEKYKGQIQEMQDQLMLAVRHIEDARMRCGKVLQYSDDGVSILDKVQKA